jgi:hypothetical protein
VPRLPITPLHPLHGGMATATDPQGRGPDFKEDQ